MSSNYFWTKTQEAILEESYRLGHGLSDAERKLPDKPKGAIATKACRMKLTTPKPRTHRS